MRSIFVLCLVGVTAASNASFELVMVLDRTTQSIKRFDSTSGVYLGSFANGVVDSANVNLMIDQPNGQVVVGDVTGATNYAQVYDYNTGQYIGDRSYFYGATYASGNSGHITSMYVPNASYVISSTIAGGYPGYSGYVENPGSSFSMSGSATGSRIYAVDLNTKTLHWWNSLYATSSAGSVALANPASFQLTGEMAVTATRLAFASSVGGTAALWLGDINTGSGTPTMRSFNISSRYTTAYHTVFGHNDDVYIGAVKASGERVIARYNFVTGAWRGEFGGGGQISDIAGLTMVVAPEPAPFVAMGVGVGVLIGRSRRKCAR